MKNAKKILMLVLCAALLVSVTVAGTVAYLTSKATVTNTFTVGKVAITMDESDVDNSDAGDRDMNNVYHLIPGSTYKKDPIVHVEAKSESSWVFVKVENGLLGYEDASNTIASQIEANNWSHLETSADGKTTVYYKDHAYSESDKDYPVFVKFTVAGSNVQGTNWTGLNDAKIIVTAYAIQKTNGSGEFTAKQAWDQVKDLQ